MKKEERKGKRVLGYMFYYSAITDRSRAHGHVWGVGHHSGAILVHEAPNQERGVFICVIPGQ